MRKVIFILLVISLLTFVTYILSANEQINYATDDRFIKVFSEDTGRDWFRVYCDKKTKVMYLLFDTYKGGGGVTVLVDKDGKPLLYE